VKAAPAGSQQVQHYLYDSSGTITTGGTAQLVLARSVSRSFLKLQNISAEPLWFEFGSARATATITNGTVTSCTVTNSGFNFTKPPVVRFWGGGPGFGGGAAINSSYLGLNQPQGTAPSRVALGHAVMSGSAGNLSLASITIDDPGAGYVIAPFVMIFNSDLDPYGVATPSATVGVLLAASSPPLLFNGTCCPTDPISVYGATSGQQFTCKWMD
jgi:hypothetical protein